MNRRIYYLILTILLSVVFNCKKEDTSPLFLFNVFAWENQIIITDIVEKYMMKNFEILFNESLNLKNKAYEFKNNPNIQNLISWQNALKSVYRNLTLVELFNFGPSNDSRTIYKNIYSWTFGQEPCYQSINCTTSVQSIINGSENIDQNYINNLGTKVKGITILEYLIFTDGGQTFSQNKDEQNVLNSLHGRKLDYAVALSENLNDNIQILYNNWKVYKHNLLNPSIHNNYYKSQLDIISEFNVQIIDQLSRIIDRKIGYPAGLNISSSGNINLNRIESLYAEQSIVSIYNNLLSIYEIYNGNYNRKGLKHILYRSDEELAELTSQKIEEILYYFQIHLEKKRDLKYLIEYDSENLKTVYNKIRNIRIFFSSEFVSATGTNPGVGSSDGD